MAPNAKDTHHLYLCRKDLLTLAVNLLLLSQFHWRGKGSPERKQCTRSNTARRCRRWYLHSLPPGCRLITLMWPLCHWYRCSYDHWHALLGTRTFFPGLWAALGVVTGSEVEPLQSWMFCPLPCPGSCFLSHAFSNQTHATLRPKSPIWGLAVPAEWLRAADQRLSLHISKILFSHLSESSVILGLTCLPCRALAIVSPICPCGLVPPVI